MLRFTNRGANMEMQFNCTQPTLATYSVPKTHIISSAKLCFRLQQLEHFVEQ